MGMRSITIGWDTVYGIDTTGGFLPATGWMDAGNVGSLRASLELRGKTGFLSVVPAYQVADDPQSPGAAANVGSAATADGFNNASAWTDVSSTTGAKQLVRFGTLSKLTEGTTLAVGRVAIKFDILTT